MNYVRFIADAEPKLEQQLIDWIKWAVVGGCAPERLVLVPPVEEDLRRILDRLNLAAGAPARLTRVQRFYGLPVAINDKLAERSVVIECGYRVPALPAAKSATYPPGRPIRPMSEDVKLSEPDHYSVWR